MNKITVIQLLNKIANEEEVPKKIKYKGTSYEYKEGIDYSNLSGDYLLSTECVSKEFLNSEVEIIEEDKEIKPLCKLANYKVNTGDDFLNGVLTGINKRINELIDKQSEVIDVVNELKKGK